MILNRINFFFISILFLATIVACVKREEFPEVDQYYVKGEIDGQEILAMQSKGQINKQGSFSEIQIIANNNVSKGFQFYIDQSVGTGVYQLDSGLFPIRIRVISNTLNGNNLPYIYKGEIDVDAIGQNPLIFKAKFHGIAYFQFWDNNKWIIDSLVVTNGIANIHF